MNNAFIEDPIRYSREMLKLKYKCRCGHSVIIPVGIKRQICHWCGHWVYADEKMKFREKFKEIKRRSER